MNCTSSTKEKTVVQSSECDTEQAKPVHIEETPCVVIAAVRVVHEFAQPRTMHAWMT